MGVAFIIAGGLVLMTFCASLFDYLGKKKKKVDAILENKVVQLEQRLFSIEERILQKDERIQQLESEVSFINKLIEHKQN